MNQSRSFPRLVPGLAVVQRDGEVVVEGGLRRRRYRGALAQALLVRPELLDGTLTVADLATALEADVATIGEACEALGGRGVLQLAPRPWAPATGSTPLQVYLGRLLPAERLAAMPDGLASARVRVVGDTPIAGRILDLLRAEGIGVLAGDPDPVKAHTDLQIEVDWPAPAGTASATPRLRVAAVAGAVEVGPLFGPAGARCASCFGRGRPAGDPPTTPGGTAVAIGAGMAVAVTLQYLTGLGPTAAWTSVLRLELPAGLWEQIPAPCDPGCESCGSPGKPLDPQSLRQLDDEQAVEAPPRGGALDPLTAEGRPGLAPVRDYVPLPRWPTRRRTIAEVTRAAGASVPGSLRQLAWALLHSGGTMPHRSDLTGAAMPRWVPSLGNLGAVQPYLLGDGGDRPFLGTGAYFDPGSGELVALRSADPRAGDGLSFESATVALVADVATAVRRFGDVGRRVVLQDTGQVLAQLALACQALGWRARPLPGPWHDRVIAALDLHPTRDLPTALVRIEVAGELLPSGERPSGGWATPEGLVRTLRRRRMRYQFGPRAVDLPRLAGSLRRGRQLAERSGIAPAVADLSLTLFARRVAGAGPGAYVMAPGGELARWTEGDRHQETIERYLGDRGLDFPALALFSADLVGALRARGVAAYRELVVAAAATANLAGLAAVDEGLDSGLIGLLPSTCLAGGPGAGAGGRRVLMGLALGDPDGSRPSGIGSHVAW